MGNGSWAAYGPIAHEIMVIEIMVIDAPGLASPKAEILPFLPVRPGLAWCSLVVRAERDGTEPASKSALISLLKIGG
jgi:hypothetical protein